MEKGVGVKKLETEPIRTQDKGFFHRKVILPIVTILRQGVTPKKVALSMAFGITLGIFPVIGATTLLCLIAALLLRLNLIAIQAFNWLVYPVQILLLIPFFKLGDYLFRSELLSLTARELIHMFRTDFFKTMYLLWWSIFHAVVVWIFIAPPLVLGLYVIFVPLVKKMSHKGEG